MENKAQGHAYGSVVPTVVSMPHHWLARVRYSPQGLQKLEKGSFKSPYLNFLESPQNIFFFHLFFIFLVSKNSMMKVRNSWMCPRNSSTFKLITATCSDSAF